MDEAARMRRLEELFHQAVDLAEEQRSALLAPLRRTDPGLVADVERLLDRADRGQDLSAVGALAAAGAAALPTATAATADRIGPYRLVERIGQGGMGEVFRAERADGQYRQTVAVKLIRSGFVTPELRQRFRFERQVLARLEHPNIARLLDGSVAPDGSPYLVMEYVEGRPVTEFCDRERLSLERRLELFRTVCRAVAHAHRNLIVHRDLKPSNILVTAEGEVKLLDFGIAKLLAPDDEAGPELTQTRSRLMTPGYASPEQVRGQAVTTATDVYALGLLLYELLCGRCAQLPEDGSAAALERAVCEEGQPRPSDALSAGDPKEVAARAEARGGVRPARLRKQIRGDLDTIAAAALRKDPARRYSSAQQLSEDVDRHLTGQPVVARPDTLSYRAAKFLRRHRLAAAASTAIALSIVLGLVLALVGLTRAQRAERRALDEAATSGQISEFLVDLFRANEPAEARGETVTARELLDRGVERIGEQLADRPAVQARLLRAMAQAYKALGLFDPALELTERELALEETHFGGTSEETGTTLVELAELHAERGDYARALALARRALAVLEPVVPADDQRLSDAGTQIARAHAQLGDLAESEAALARAVALMQRRLGPDHGDLWSPLNNLAILAWMQGDPAKARDRFTRALALAERKFGGDHPSVAHLLNNLALAQLQAGEPELAIATHRRALAMREKVLAPDHVDVAESLNNLGSALLAIREYAAAREVLERALAIRESALGPEHYYVATTVCNLGLALLGTGDADAARPLLERSLRSFESAVGADHAAVSHPLLGLARIEWQRGRPEAAELAFRRAIEIREARLAEHHPDLAGALQEYADFLRSRGRDAEAEVLERRAASAQPAAAEPGD